jgi:phage-related protein
MAKRLEVTFFRLATGKEPVREWLLSLDKQDRQILGDDIRTVEFGWPLGMPTCRPLTDGLWEIRSSLSHGRIARVVFGIVDGEMILLTGFIKKTQATPSDQVKIARQRLKEYKEQQR